MQRTFAAAGFETRILHPFVTKQYRQPVDPGNKTDDTDLMALQRATVTGCAPIEASRDAAWTTLRLVVRQRRDLVHKGAALNCQIREHREAAVPGFAACFDKLGDSAVPWHFLQHFPSAAQLQVAGLTTLCQSLRQAGIRFQQRTVQTVLDWAAQAASGDIAADQHLRVAWAYYRDRQRKTLEIQALERERAGRRRRPTSCCSPSQALTASVPPTLVLRPDPSNTMPTPRPSQDAPVRDRPVIRATK